MLTNMEEIDLLAKRKAYYRQYYREHVNLESERKRKQEFYEKNRE